MQYRLFGKTKIQVSEIGHGTWPMGSHWGPRDDRTAINSLLASIDLGVNFIDTAFAYGNGHSENLISSALKARNKKEIFIATKVPPKNGQWPARHHISVHEAFTKKHVISSTEKSLQNLRRDFVDLQQLHVWSDNWLNQGDYLDGIEKLKQDGKIRFFGISINDHQPNTALKIVESGLIDSVQVIYNIFDQTPAEKLFPLCKKHNVAVIARVPFDEGSLTGTLTPETKFHPKDWRKKYFTPERLVETCARVEKLQFLIRDEIKNLSQASLKFCLSHPQVSVVIPGMRKINHVGENCAASDGKLLTVKELEKIKEHAWNRNFYPTYG